MKKSILAVALMSISISSVFADSSLQSTGSAAASSAAPANKLVIPPVNYPGPPTYLKPGQTMPLTEGETQWIRCRNLGVNLDGMAYFSASEPFIDLASTAEAWHRPWGSKYSKQPIKVNKEGYPVDVSPDNSVVSMVNAFQWTRATPESPDSPYDLPTEPYVLTWTGSGTINLGGPVTVISRSANKVVFKLNPPVGKFWLITSPNGGSTMIGNVHIVPQSMQGTKEIFDKKYLNTIEPFKTLRFMDWGQTNGNPLQHWADRPTPNSYTQASNTGAAYEYMLALANKLNDNLWVNIPIGADDDYILQMAKLFRANMKPGQIVYVEYSNEVWNWGFQQGTDLEQRAEAAGYNKPATGAYSAGAGYIARLELYSQQVVKIANIWHSVFEDKYGGYGPKAMVLMAGQEAEPGVLQTEMDFNNNGSKVDAATVAFYFMGNKLLNNMTAPQWRNATPAQLSSAAIGQFDNLSTLTENLAEAKKYGKPLFFYEGGQGLTALGKEPDGTWMANDKPIMDLMLNVNHDPSIGAVYTAALNKWQSELGGGLFMLFNLNGAFSKWGYWGLMDGESAKYSDSPKLDAVYNYCDWNPAAFGKQ